MVITRGESWQTDASAANTEELLLSLSSGGDAVLLERATNGGSLGHMKASLYVIDFEHQLTLIAVQARVEMPKVVPTAAITPGVAPGTPHRLVAAGHRALHGLGRAIKIWGPSWQ